VVLDRARQHSAVGPASRAIGPARLWSDAALNEDLAAIHAQEARFPQQVTYADPNDVEAEGQACTARRSRTG
jgi:hypothetical protein